MRGGGSGAGCFSGTTCAAPCSGAWSGCMAGTRGSGSRIPAYQGSPVAVTGGVAGVGDASGEGCPDEAGGTVTRSASALRSTATSFRNSSSCLPMLPVRAAVMIARINSAMGISAIRKMAPSIRGVAPNYAARRKSQDHYCASASQTWLPQARFPCERVTNAPRPESRRLTALRAASAPSPHACAWRVWEGLPAGGRGSPPPLSHWRLSPR